MPLIESDMRCIESRHCQLPWSTLKIIFTYPTINGFIMYEVTCNGRTWRHTSAIKPSPQSGDFKRYHLFVCLSVCSFTFRFFLMQFVCFSNAVRVSFFPKALWVSSSNIFPPSWTPPPVKFIVVGCGGVTWLAYYSVDRGHSGPQCSDPSTATQPLHRKRYISTSNNCDDSDSHK